MRCPRLMPAIFLMASLLAEAPAQSTCTRCMRERGWGLLGGHGESGSIVGVNFQLEDPLGDGPSLLMFDILNISMAFRDDYQFLSISSLPTLMGMILAFSSGSYADTDLVQILFIALVAPEAIGNMGLGFENEKHQRVAIALDSFAYTSGHRDTAEEFDDSEFLGMQFRPHIGLTLPLHDDRTSAQLSGGYNYDWSWQRRSQALGWDLQVGIVRRFGPES